MKSLLDERPQDAVKSAFQEHTTVFRKVARSGHISYAGTAYFVSKALAGRVLCVTVLPNRLVIDTTIMLHKEYQLKP